MAEETTGARVRPDARPTVVPATGAGRAGWVALAFLGALGLGVLAVFPFVIAAAAVDQLVLAPLGVTAKEGSFGLGAALEDLLVLAVLLLGWSWLSRRVAARSGARAAAWVASVAGLVMPVTVFVLTRP